MLDSTEIRFEQLAVALERRRLIGLREFDFDAFEAACSGFSFLLDRGQ